MWRVAGGGRGTLSWVCQNLRKPAELQRLWGPWVCFMGLFLGLRWTLRQCSVMIPCEDAAPCEED